MRSADTIETRTGRTGAALSVILLALLATGQVADVRALALMGRACSSAATASRSDEVVVDSARSLVRAVVRRVPSAQSGSSESGTRLLQITGGLPDARAPGAAWRVLARV